MKRYSIVINLVRNFLNKLNFIELFTQNKLSILTICNEPKSMCTFNYGGYVWPLPQSSIIWLEYELINNVVYIHYALVIKMTLIIQNKRVKIFLKQI